MRGTFKGSLIIFIDGGPSKKYEYYTQYELTFAFLISRRSWEIYEHILECAIDHADKGGVEVGRYFDDCRIYMDIGKQNGLLVSWSVNDCSMGVTMSDFSSFAVMWVQWHK